MLRIIPDGREGGRADDTGSVEQEQVPLMQEIGEVLDLVQLVDQQGVELPDQSLVNECASILTGACRVGLTWAIPALTESPADQALRLDICADQITRLVRMISSPHIGVYVYHRD